MIGVWLEIDPCGLDVVDAGEPNCLAINQPAHDTVANERLLRCIASSPDHYQSVAVADLPDAFQDVASDIISRSLLQ